MKFVVVVALGCLWASGCLWIPEHYRNHKEVYFQNNPDVSAEMRQLINESKIRRWMTGEQVLASWGLPGSRKKHVGEHGEFERWTYLGTSVYFENGLVSSWTTVER